MKKILVILTVFGIASIANAGLIDVVVTNNDEDTSGSYTLNDTVDIEIWLTGGISDGYDLDLHVTGPATLSEHGGGPITIHQLAVSEAMFPFVYSGLAGNSISQMSHVDFMGTFDALSALVGGLQVSLDDVNQWVNIDLTLNGATRVDIGGGWIPVTEDDLGDVSFYVLPEPATIALLGLGGLLLRRRK